MKKRIKKDWSQRPETTQTKQLYGYYKWNLTREGFGMAKKGKP